VRLDVRLFLSDLPIIGRYVDTPMVPIPGVYAWIVRHDRFRSWYWRDPYGFRTNYGDPRSDWGPEEKAYRFRSEREARQRLEETGQPGHLVKVTLREEVLP
jgi:hypothetical protein